MKDLLFLNEMIDKGFSPFIVNDNKIPLTYGKYDTASYETWKPRQTKAFTKEEFRLKYTNAPNNFMIGMATGFNDLEVLDIDLKVLDSVSERKEWFDEYIAFLEDNIEDFHDKVVIYKTMNAGYHILFRSKSLCGNTKIAKLKGMKEAIIETRSTGGYVVVYDKQYNNRSYLDVDYITDEDRDILFSCSRSYNYIEEVAEAPKKASNNVKISQEGLSPWEDYNQRESSLDLLTANGFKVVRRLSDKTLFKRDGATSSHSGYVFHDSGMMYMHSTGTQFENELGYMPFHIYTILNHNGDKSEATKALYNAGYGDRYVNPMPVIEDEEEEVIETEFPLEVFPKDLVTYMRANNKALNHNVDFMAGALLYVTSVIIGNSMKAQPKVGWIESANIWLSIVGNAGAGKTPSISVMTKPLESLNGDEIMKFIDGQAKFEAYQNLDKKEQALEEQVGKPRRTQFVVNDITMEALVEMHNENQNGVGVMKDELAGFFKSMNQYRDGGDMEHWLSSWSGKDILLNRKTAGNSFVQNAFLPIMGGIQPSIMDLFQTEENIANGFLDRMLFVYPFSEPQYLSNEDLNPKLIEWYDDYIKAFFQDVKRGLRFDKRGSVIPKIVEYTPEAYKKFEEIHTEITDRERGDSDELEIKSMFPKQKGYLSRFALLINTLNSLSDDAISRDVISLDSVLKAEKLFNYFVSMKKKILSESQKRSIAKSIVKKGTDPYTNFKALIKSNPNMKNKDIAEALRVSGKTITRYKNKFKNE